MTPQGLAEQPLAVTVPIRPCRVEEVAAELDGSIERAQRFLVGAAGPSGHSPHPVPDFRDHPAGATETTIVHRTIVWAAASAARPRVQKKSPRATYELVGSPVAGASIDQ